MIEEYNGEKTIVKFTEAEINQMKNGKIFEGYRVSVGMEIRE
jgi:hypothetical protein